MNPIPGTPIFDLMFYYYMQDEKSGYMTKYYMKVNTRDQQIQIVPIECTEVFDNIKKDISNEDNC